MNLAYFVPDPSLLLGFEQGSRDPQPWSNKFKMLDLVSSKLCKAGMVISKH